MEPNAVIGAVVVGVGAAICVALLVVSRSARRRELRKGPPDPDSVEAMRLAQREGAEQKRRTTETKYGDSGGGGGEGAGI